MSYFETTFEKLSSVMRGFTVSLILITGALPALYAGHLADRLGRTYAVAVGALVFAVGSALQGGSSELPMFLVGRGLAGIGEGLWLSNINVYITEIAPSARRGMLVSMPQFQCTAGICAGYFTCYGSSGINSSMSWRLPFILQSALAVLLTLSCLLLPKSPRWLMFHGHREEAMRELDRLDVSRAEAEKDILRPAEQGRPNSSQPTSKGFLTIFQRQYRSRTILGLFVLAMVQLCGIDSVLYYAPTLFRQAGLPSETATFLASGVSSILMLAISIPAFLYADRWGRRTLAITGGIVLSSCMLTIGSLYASKSVHAHEGAGKWIVIVLIFAFALAYCATWAVFGKIYASEIQPAHTRAAANSLAQGLNFLTNWIVSFATPIFLAHSSFGAYFLFGFLSLATVMVLAVYMPETRGQSLESIQEAFHRPVARSWAHHIRGLWSGPSSSGRRSEISLQGVLREGTE
ncbi:MAG: hypothetical protein M1834_004795 [Cirrosporium novae-zelandiae]|nr:MAG: hypothetical protein M1834_004795 [Cirrosporium novae-zelandiae]